MADKRPKDTADRTIGLSTGQDRTGQDRTGGRREARTEKKKKKKGTTQAILRLKGKEREREREGGMPVGIHTCRQ